MADTIRFAKFRRFLNSYSPIMKLNADVLSIIFLFNTQLDRNDEDHTPSLATRSVSQVCSYWRQVALGLPRLWASSLDFGEDYGRLCSSISRTGNCALDIMVPPIPHEALGDLYPAWLIPFPSRSSPHLFSSPSRNKFHQQFQLALSLFHRARVFMIQDQGENRHQIVSELSKPSEHIETLSVYFTGSKLVSLPEDLLANRAPHLRSLDLYGCTCNMMSSIFHNLTSLAILDNPKARHQRNPVLWQNVLKNMPKLERLDVDLKSDDCLFSDSQNVVSLPNLQFIRLSEIGSHLASSVLFSCLDFPLSCGMDISIEFAHHQFDEHCKSLFSSLRKRFLNPATKTSNTGLRLIFKEEHILVRNSAHGYVEHEALRLSFRAAAYIELEKVVITTFVEAMENAFLHVDALFLNISYHMPSIYTIPLLRLFSSVKYLHIQEYFTFKRVVAAFNLVPSRAKPQMLPALCKLSLEDFRSWGEEPEDQDEAEDLRCLLRHRPKIKSIKFRDCDDFWISLGEEQLGVKIELRNSTYDESDDEDRMIAGRIW